MVLSIFFIIFSAITLYNLRYGIYLIIFSMPLYLWRFSAFNIPTTALEIMIYILFLAWIVNLLKLKKFHTLGYGTFKSIFYFNIFNNIFNKNYFILSAGIILLFSGAITSTALSSDIRTSLGILKGWFFDPLLFFIVFINIIKTGREIHLVLKSWLASGLVVSLIGIFYLLSENLTFDGRLRAFFLSPNHLAMYLAPPLLIALGFLANKTNFNIYNTNKKLEIGNWKLENPKLEQFPNKVFQVSSFKFQAIVLIIILIPLYYTYSFGAFLGIFAGVLYLTAKNINFKIKSIYWMSFIILLFSGLIFLSSGKFNQIIDSNNRSSFHSRLMIWSLAGEIIKDNSFFGIGPGTFQEKYLSYSGKFSEPYLEWAVPQPHNIFLAFYLQTGLIGFVGFILILAWFFQGKRCRVLSKQQVNAPFLNVNDNNNFISNFQFPINNILASLMIYILIHGLVDTTYWKNDLSVMFWLIVGGGLTTFKIYAKLQSHDKNESNLKTK